MEEVKKKLEEKLQDTDLKVINNEEKNKERFTSLEDKIEELSCFLKDSKEHNNISLNKMQEEINLSQGKQDDLIDKFAKLEHCVEENEKEKNSEETQMIKEKIEEFTREISFLKDRLQQNSAMTMKDFTEVEMQLEEKDQHLQEILEEINGKFESIEGISDKGNEDAMKKIGNLENVLGNLQESFTEMSNVMENVLEKMYEFESQKKNNLIFYGVTGEDDESSVKLMNKVKEVIRGQLNIQRLMVVRRVSRMFTGPKVFGCRPVLVTFENFDDREDVLQSSLVSMGRSSVSVTEDLSQKTREARQELKRFVREVRKINPEKRCFVKYDKLFIDGKMFVYSEVEGR